MASGVFFALLDHDDLLHPCALWYAARAIAEQGADFVYTEDVYKRQVQGRGRSDPL